MGFLTTPHVGRSRANISCPIIVIRIRLKLSPPWPPSVASFPPALHLMGVLHYQKGDPEAAIRYIERALHCTAEGGLASPESLPPPAAAARAAAREELSPAAEGAAGKAERAAAAADAKTAVATAETAANFHNSLGECLRAAGRASDAALHFRRALSLAPGMAMASFNLGLTYQQLHDYDKVGRGNV